jgi:hypothetical protein
MRTQTGFLKRVGGGVMIAALALAIGVPALAGDDDKPRDRSIDREPVVRESDRNGTGDQPGIEPMGVEWTF